MGSNLEEIRMDGNQTVALNNPVKNQSTIIRNKVKDFDCMNDSLIICTSSGEVLVSRADFDYRNPTLNFHSLSSLGSGLENYNYVSKISCGDSHCLMLTTSGFCYSFGSGNNGRLGLGDSDDRDEPSMLYNLLDFCVDSVHTTADSSFVWWRVRNDIPVPITHSISRTEKVSTVVDSDKNIVFSWGRGDTGCLGHDGDEDLDVPTPVTLSIEEWISSIVTGKHHVFALNNEKSWVYAWGNYYNDLVSFISATRLLKGNPKLLNSAGLTIATMKAKHDSWKTSGSSKSWASTNLSSGVGNSYSGIYDSESNGPLDVHIEMKKQNVENRIEIKTLDDEDLDEMNDCEIEVEEEDIIHEDAKQSSASKKSKNSSNHKKVMKKVIVKTKSYFPDNSDDDVSCSPIMI